ncbi:MAG: hypothetical protein ACJ79T_14405 [Myxococcales bacterium]
MGAPVGEVDAFQRERRFLLRRRPDGDASLLERDPRRVYGPGERSRLLGGGHWRFSRGKRAAQGGRGLAVRPRHGRDVDPRPDQAQLADVDLVRLQGDRVDVDADPLRAEDLVALGVAQVDAVGAHPQEARDVDPRHVEAALDRFLRLLGDLASERAGATARVQPDDRPNDGKEHEADRHGETNGDAAPDPAAHAAPPGSGALGWPDRRDCGRRLGRMRLTHASAV